MTLNAAMPLKSWAQVPYPKNLWQSHKLEPSFPETRASALSISLPVSQDVLRECNQDLSSVSLGCPHCSHIAASGVTSTGHPTQKASLQHPVTTNPLPVLCLREDSCRNTLVSLLASFSFPSIWTSQDSQGPASAGVNCDSATEL